MFSSGRVRVAMGIAASGLALGSCSDEQRFTAEGFIAATNEGGAGLTLGSALPSTREGTRIYSVATEQHDEPDASGEPGHLHGGGTLTVLPDEESALAEYERCEGAVSLLCFRAANVVLFFEEDLEAAEETRIATALEALAAE